MLAGDLHRYFTEIPGCSDAWWALLRGGIADLWGARSLTHSGLTPVHRLTGWLVEQDRREDAAAVMTYVAALGRPLDRVDGPDGRRIDVPVLDLAHRRPGRARAPAARALTVRAAGTVARGRAPGVGRRWAPTWRSATSTTAGCAGSTGRTTGPSWSTRPSSTCGSR